MKVIRFKFNLDKFINTVSYLASHINDLTKLKAAKLLYLMDWYHIRKYGRPVIGDTYFRLDKGPVPSLSLDIMNECIESQRIQNLEQPNKVLFNKYIEIDTSKSHPQFKTKKECDIEVFSDSEIQVINTILKKYGKNSVGNLIEITHKHSTWKKTKRNSEIDYRLFLEGLGDKKKKQMLHILEVDQEDRELFDLF